MHARPDDAGEVAAPPWLHDMMGFLAEVFRHESEVAGDEELARRCAVHVTGNDRLTPGEQVDLYRRQFFLRHHESLREDYPGLAHVLGEGPFEAFCNAYLAAHPPRTPSLRDLGADIVAFAESYPGFPANQRALALDMLRYEHTFIDVFDGPEAAPLDPSSLKDLPDDAWERARIELCPTLALVRLGHPVHRLRAALRPASAEAAQASLELPGEGEVHLGVYRKNRMIHYEELEPAAFALLEALRRGVPLVKACDEVAAGLDADGQASLGQQVAPWFQQWTARRWIAGVRLP